MSLSLDFISKECKNKNQFSCKYQWEGYGFQIFCNCECHRKLVLDKAILKNDSSDGYNVITELNFLGESNK